MYLEWCFMKIKNFKNEIYMKLDEDGCTCIRGIYYYPFSWQKFDWIYPYTQLVCAVDSCFMAEAEHFCHGPMHKVLSIFNTYYINIIEWTIKLATWYWWINMWILWNQNKTSLNFLSAELLITSRLLLYYLTLHEYFHVLHNDNIFLAF